MQMKLRTTISIHEWILLASLLSAIPLLLFAIGMTYHQLDSQRQREELALQQRGDAAAVTVKRRLDRASAALEALAISDAALDDTMNALYRQATHVVAAHPDAIAIWLVRQDGEQIFSTTRHFGEPLPRSMAMPFGNDVFTRGQVAYSDLFRGALTGRLAMAVAVPVRVNGRIKYSLRMSLPVEVFTTVLNDQQWPAEWIGLVLDPRGLIAGRTRDAGKYAGSPMTEDLRAAIASGRRGIVDSVTQDNRAVKIYVTAVPGTGWNVAVSVPAAAFFRDAEINLRLLLLGAAASLLLGVIGSSLIAKSIGRQVGLLIQASRGTIDAKSAHLADSPIREVAAITGALSQVQGRERELATRLKKARHDPLTGLPRRELFQEYVQEALASRHSLAVGSAVLYIDLDGFKSVNDRYGHDAGDRVLHQVGDAIRHVTRERDIAGRLGGDEFAIFIMASPETLCTTATTVAYRLIERIGEIGFGIGCSIGIATAPPRACNVDTLIANADAAMLRVKREGKNNFSFAQESPFLR